MRILLLSTLTLALYAGPAAAQDYRTARTDRAASAEREAAPPDGQPAQRPAAAPGQDPQTVDRMHARRARDMARTYHASDEEADSPRQHEPLTISDAVMVQDTDSGPDRD